MVDFPTAPGPTTTIARMAQTWSEKSSWTTNSRGVRDAYARMVSCPNAKTPMITSNAPIIAALIGASADHGTSSIAKKKRLMSMMSFLSLKLAEM